MVEGGHNREACLLCEEDKQSYLHWVGEALTRERVQLHAYALMTNHVHLLVTPETDVKGVRVDLFALDFAYASPPAQSP